MSCQGDSCSICLCEVTDPVRLCGVCNDAFCRACLTQYIESLVHNAFHGSCPSITCPSLAHATTRKPILPIDQWTPIVSPAVVTQYHDLAAELLSMRCGECHQVSSQLVAHDRDAACEYLSTIYQPETLQALHTHVALFCAGGDMSIEDFYQAVLHQHCPELQSQDNTPAWETFSSVLKLIEEPERRCNLQLRYYRDRPRMRMDCCDAVHCFQCAMCGFHEGQTCLEMRDLFDNTIIECPTCTIALVKSEGCNTVQCLCGAVWNWEDEVNRVDACQRFRMLYPVQPSVACADVLCTMANATYAYDTTVVLARAWHERHPIEVNQALVEWFRRHYEPCPSQACLLLMEDTAGEHTEGILLAMDLWRAEHATEIAHCQAQRDQAIASLFVTMHPRATDRAMAARRFTLSGAGNLPANQLMKRSVDRWIEEHRDEYDRGIVEWQQRSAQQLLLRFGSYSLPHMRPLECPPEQPPPSSSGTTGTSLSIASVTSSVSPLASSVSPPASSVSSADDDPAINKSALFMFLSELSRRTTPRSSRAPAASLLHFDALCDPSELPALSTAVPYNVGNSLRWAKLVVQLDTMVTDLDNGNLLTITMAVPKSMLITDGAQWLVHCGASVCIARERAQDVLAALREFLRLRRMRTAGSAAVSLAPLRSLPLVLVVEALSWLFHDRARSMMNGEEYQTTAASTALAFTDMSHRRRTLCA